MPDIFDLYAPQVQKLIGNIDDVVSINDFDKAMEKLNKLKQFKSDVDRFNKLKNKFFAVDKSKIPTTRDIDEEGINPDYFDILPDEMIPQQLKEYKMYQDRLKGEDGKLIKEPVSFNDYLKQVPGFYDDLKVKHPGAFTVNKKQVPLTDEEMQAEYNKLTGLSDEDIQFYMANKDVFTPSENNRYLEELIRQETPNLVSRGNLGNTLAERFQNEAMMNALNTKQPEYKYHFDNNGNMIYFDPTDPTNYNVVKYGKGKDENAGLYNKIGFRIIEKDGKYVYQFPTGTGWQDSQLEATPEQYDAYLTGIQDKGLSFEDKKEISNSYKLPRIGRKKNSGSNNVNFGNYKPGDFKKMTTESLDKLSVGDLNELKKYKKYLPNDVKREFEKRIRTSNYDDEGDNNDLSKDKNNDKSFVEGELITFRTDFENALGKMSTDRTPESKQEALDLLTEVYEWLESLNGKIDPDVLDSAGATVNEFVKTINWPY